MADPERMLEEQVQEELGHRRAAHVAAARRRGSPALATAVGALIPVFPFLRMVRHDGDRRWRSSISMASHWIVGAARSVFTGRSVFRSGLDMFVVGLGVAVVGYFVGEWIAA